MSVLNIDRKILFIHVPKTAGTSMESQSHLGLGGHIPYWIYQEVVGRGIKDVNLQDFFKFAFVRNPLDRFVSSFFYNRVRDRIHLDVTFREFVLKLKDIEPIEERVKLKEPVYINYPFRWELHVHFLPQWYFITDKRGDLAMDFVGKFENMPEDWYKVCEKTSLNRELPRYRVNKHKPYREYYDDELEEIVRNFYKKDFEMFYS